MSVRVQPLELQELVDLVNRAGTLPRRVGARTDQRPGNAEREVADRLHPVFAAEEDAERARLVNAVLTEVTVRPEVAQDGERLTAAWSVAEPSTALLASAALALREHLAAHPGRLGVCTDRQCADTYVDVSPTGRRRFCSKTCQTRSRVALFRERQREAKRSG